MMRSLQDQNLFLRGLSQFLIILIFTGIVVIAQEETQCRGQDVNMSGEQKQQITDCLKEYKISSIWKIPAEKMACFGTCVLTRKKLITADGRLDQPKVIDYIELIMRPEEVKKPLKDGVIQCVKDNGDKIKENNDPSCTAFIRVGNCMHDVFLDLCIED